MLADVQQEEYPYGLRISLGEDELAKLGVTGLPAIDTDMRLSALVCVVSISQHENQGGKPERRVELQIEQMALAGAAEDDAAESMYPTMSKRG